MSTSILFRRLRHAGLMLPLAFGLGQAQWVKTGLLGPKEQGRTEAIIGSGANIYAATNGAGVFHSADQGTSWTAGNEGFSIYLAIICMASVDNTLFAGAYLSGVYRSTDNGKTWTAANTGVTNTQPKAFALKGSDLFVATNGGGVFRSSDKGDKWTSVSAGITDYFVQKIIASGPDLFAGTQTGIVYHSSDNGETWTVIRAAGDSDQEVTGLAVIGSSLFVGTKGNGVYVSSDMGAAWKAVNNGMSTFSIHALAASGDHLFAATTSGGGFFHSKDNGANWTQEIAGLTDKDLQTVTVIGSDLYAGTYGKVWRRPLSELGVVALRPSSPNSEASGFAPGLDGSLHPGSRISFRLDKAARIDLSVFGMDGKKAATLAHGVLAAGDHQPVFAAAGLPAGLYCFRLQIDGTSVTRRLRLE
jgi:photosystem II stability/assembly factor-like uncharacterized protein